MSEVDNLFERLQKMNLSDLMVLCSEALKTKMDDKKLDMLLMLLESRLQKRNICKRLNLKDDEANNE